MSTDVHPVILIVTLDKGASPAEVNKATTQLYRALLAGNAEYVEKPRRGAPKKGLKATPLPLAQLRWG